MAQQPRHPAPDGPSDAGASAEDVAWSIARKIPELTKLQEPARRQKIQEIMEIEVGFSGPLPPPDMLARYNEIIPDGANRLLSMVEADLRQSHVMATEGMALQRDAEARRGRIVEVEQTYRMSGLAAGVLAFFGMLALTAYVAFLGHTGLAAAFGGTTLLGVVGTFVYGRRQQPAPPDPPPKVQRKK